MKKSGFAFEFFVLVGRRFGFVSVWRARVILTSRNLIVLTIVKEII